jgi:outer membrane receptor for ferrienterochelin and colicins
MITLRTSLALVLAALALPASAEEDVSDLAGLLDEHVVSTASKSAETAGLAPATTSVITGDDLRRHGISSLDEAINFLGMGMLTEPSYATPEIGARGVLLSGDYGNHVLLLVDGHALNEPWDGTAYYDRSAAIPMDMVDHIELILGPGSVLYGSSAMLGVINVITKRAKDYAGLHLLAEGGAPGVVHGAAGYGDQFVWFGQEAEVTAGLDYFHSWGPGLAIAAQPYGGAVWGGADTNHRAIEVPGGHLRLVTGNFDVAIRAASSVRTAANAWGSFNDPNNWERDRWLSLDARWSASLSPNLQASVRLYGDLYDYLENDPSASSLDCLDGQASCLFRSSGVSRWAGVEANGTWDWLQDGRFVTLAGTDVRYRHVTSFSAYDDAATGVSTVVAPYDKSGAIFGAYLQQTLHPSSWLSVNAGLRVDHDDQLGNHLSPRVAAVVPAWEGGTVKAIYSEAFRAPTFFERYYTDNRSWLAAPDLKPETVKSIEGVVEQRVGAQRLTLGVFQTWWNDLVLLVPATAAQMAAAVAAGALDPSATSVSIYANASRVNSYGLNAGFEGSALAHRLRYGATFTWAHSRQEADGETTLLPAAAQVFGNVRASYELGRKLPVLSLAARFAGPRPLSGTSFSPTPDAKPQVEVRGALSGPIGGGLSYRFSASWAATDGSAYAVGPLRGPDTGYTSQAVLPLPRFQAWAGLSYER